MTRARYAVALWLAAITAANLITAHFGPNASIVTALCLVSLTLVLRDVLHDIWSSRRAVKMGALILTGSALAYLVTPSAGRIGLASAAAFGVSETLDAIAYGFAHRLEWFRRSNLSNLIGAAVDSLVFPTLAFGGVLWTVTAGQFGAKVAGALVVTLVLDARKARA